MWQFWVAGFVLLFVAGFLGMRYLEGRRARGFERAMQEIGFAYQRYGAPLSDGQMNTLPLLSQGYVRSFCNVGRGSTGAGETTVFDYLYSVRLTSPTGQYAATDSRTYDQTVALFRWTGPALPRFRLAPERWIEKLGAVLGEQDINFDTNAGFSSRFRLQGGDEAAIRRFFTPPVLSYFESLEEGQQWTLEGSADMLLLYAWKRQEKAQHLGSFLQQASAMVSGLRAVATV